MKSLIVDKNKKLSKFILDNVSDITFSSFMNALKKHGFLQMLIGFSSAILLLMGFYILGEKVTFPETAFWNVAEPVILVAFMLSYMAFLSLLAIFSKAYNLKFLYYPVFGTCLTSVISAIIYFAPASN